MSDSDDTISEAELLAVEEEAALSEALRSAWSPAPLSPGLNAFIVAQALLDPEAPPSEEEQAGALALRESLAGGALYDVPLLQALKHAHAPEEPRSAALRRLPNEARPSRLAQVIYLSFGIAASAAAIAAGSVLWLAPIDEATEGAQAPLAKSRASAVLFEQGFQSGATSARIDKIASVRARELRSNRYRRWGLR
jgi:hypothetical protein